jgi:aspartyl-tRNA(Asn)/glutamyl-tRNA(Gln) amidotransferase subunit A
VASVPLSVTEAAEALRAGDLTSLLLTEACLERTDTYDGALGAYLARFDETALVAAQAADEDLARGADRGPLHGLPIGVKDVLAAKEGDTTAQSQVLDREWGRGRDASVVARLRNAGAVITGKLTTLEFAAGLPDPDKPYPIPRNPWNPDCYPGGSSAGAGVAVASGMVLAGIGTDTGGSLRLPAAFCGVSGLKPTYGLVPKTGSVPLAYSLDHVGPICRSASDCAAVLGAITGYDRVDPTCVDRPVENYLCALSDDLHGLRIGVDSDLHHAALTDPALAECFDNAVVQLTLLGATISRVSLPYYDQAVAAHTVTMTAEALAYHREDLRTRWGDYSRAFRLVAAQGALSSAADYVQAQRVRRVVQGAVDDLFREVDAVIGPTVAIASPRYDDLLAARDQTDPLRGAVFTSYWDVVGNPVLAVPMGISAAGLPLSLQIAGRAFEEATVLQIGHAFQQATRWHTSVPPLLADEDGRAPGAKPRLALPANSTFAAARAAEIAQVQEYIPNLPDHVRREASMLLGFASLPASDLDLAAMAGRHERRSQLLEPLWALPEARYAEPALLFSCHTRLST